MKLIVVAALVACGGNPHTLPDAAGDAFDAAADAPTELAVTMLPTAEVTVPLNSRQMFEARIAHAAGQVITATLSDPASFAITSRYCITDGTCVIDLELVPIMEGPLDGQLVLTADGGATATAHMRANVIQPNVLTIAPDRIDFLGQGIGLTSAPITATITNTGTVASGPIVLGIDDASLYHLNPTGCAGQLLAAGGSCTFTVDYTPTATTPLGSGGDFAHVSAMATPGGGTFALTAGYGLTLTITPQGQVPLPDTTVGQTSTPKTFTIKNVLGVPIGPIATSLQIILGGAFAITTDTCATTTLAAGASCTVAVTFTPANTGLSGVVLDVKAPDFGGYRNATGTMIFGTGI
ncbi:MAG: choice-of-anchor D domain-containing protein [Proteobacteria bacterium]|nr:choice-of-anchor D domain-containing protein [Pseudomonadota bacterium]